MALRNVFPSTQASQAGIVAARAPDGGRQPGAAPPKPRAQERLQRKIAEESLEASAGARERASKKIRQTVASPAELHMAAELGEEWIDVWLDDEELLLAKLLLAIRAVLQGPARGAATGRAKDAVDITIPGRVQAEGINRYMEVEFGDTFEPLPETTKARSA